jgi:DNA-binding transcriptional regulator YdaS (Cro superfamily)
MEKFREYLKANRGTATRISETIGVLPSTVSLWKQIPAEYVLAIEGVTGISRHDLRPDVFGPEFTGVSG